MTPMDRETIEKHDIAQRYLHGKLSPEESEAFEIYVMEHSELIEMLELDRVVIKTMCDASKLIKEPSILRGWRPVYSHGVALAASTALVAVLMLAPQDNKPPNLVSPDIVYLDVFRSQEVTKTVQFSGNDSSKLLVMQGAVNAQGTVDINRSFSLSFAPENSQEIGSTHENMRPNRSGELVFRLHKNVLKPGMYRVSIHGESNDVVSHFLVEILHKE